jgi:predicted enzyme related to lactoylglutathione lyase
MERTKQGEFAWVKLMAKDLEGQTAFYEQLFGWTHVDSSTLQGQPYRTFKKDGASVAGASQISPEMEAVGVPTMWHTYIAVDDVDAAAAQAEALGGKIAMPAMDIAIGRLVGVSDPGGATVFLSKSTTPDPTMEYGGPGMVALNSLATRDPEAAVKFYAELVGWDVEALTGGPIPYWQVDIGSQTQGGIMPMPDAMPPEVPDNWVVFFGVEDAAAMAAKAVELGGKAQGAPTEVPGMLVFAAISDPAGASFQLLQPLNR